METYEFRAWDKHLQEMVYDFVIDATGVVQRTDHSHSNCPLHDNDPGDYVCLDYSDWYASDLYEIHPYSKVKDINKKKIFKCDRVKWLVNGGLSIGIVKDGKYKSHSGYDCNGWYVDFGDDYNISLVEGDDFEVIGHIYEKSEEN